MIVPYSNPCSGTSAANLETTEINLSSSKVSCCSSRELQCKWTLLPCNWLGVAIGKLFLLTGETSGLWKPEEPVSNMKERWEWSCLCSGKVKECFVLCLFSFIPCHIKEENGRHYQQRGKCLLRNSQFTEKHSFVEGNYLRTCLCSVNCLGQKWKGELYQGMFCSDSLRIQRDTFFRKWCLFNSWQIIGRKARCLMGFGVEEDLKLTEKSCKKESSNFLRVIGMFYGLWVIVQSP